MTATEINRYRTLLKATELELVKALGDREGITVQRTADTIDEVVIAADRDLAVQNLDREGKLLYAVQSALARIADRSYGICLGCENAITPKRLNAVPWAAYCLACQERIDQNSPRIADFLTTPYRAGAA